MLAKLDTTLFENGRVNKFGKNLAFIPDDNNRESQLVNLYPGVTYQQIGTFGGAITESVGVTLRKMPEEERTQILESYFGKSGIGYRAIRTHIDSCDFSMGNYSAAEQWNGSEFPDFSLKRDEENIIPFIRSACLAAGEELPVMLSPWSPPAFMKTNRSKNGGGKLEKKFYPLWAKYICRYIREYRARGIKVRMLSVQNEPNAEQVWDSCLFSPQEEREFLQFALVPALRSSGLGDIELYIWDHNKERLYDRVREVITPETDSMIAGAAFHWYSGDHFDAPRLVHEQFPDKKLLFSEGCIEYSQFDKSRQLENAQVYAHDMIGNLNAGMNTFFDWNIILDEMGGPNHAGNYCEAPVIYDTQNKKASLKLSYYYIGHFSKYILPGARRIATTCYTDQLEVTAFLNPDGTLIAELLNRSMKDITAVLRLENQLLEITVKGQSMNTVVIVSESKNKDAMPNL